MFMLLLCIVMGGCDGDTTVGPDPILAPPADPVVVVPVVQEKPKAPEMPRHCARIDVKQRRIIGVDGLLVTFKVEAYVTGEYKRFYVKVMTDDIDYLPRLIGIKNIKPGISEFSFRFPSDTPYHRRLGLTVWVEAQTGDRLDQCDAMLFVTFKREIPPPPPPPPEECEKTPVPEGFRDCEPGQGMACGVTPPKPCCVWVQAECKWVCDEIPPLPCPPVGEPECPEQRWDTELCAWVGECLQGGCSVPPVHNFKAPRSLGNPQAECEHFGNFEPAGMWEHGEFHVTKCGLFYEVTHSHWWKSKCSNGQRVSHRTKCICADK